LDISLCVLCALCVLSGILPAPAATVPVWSLVSTNVVADTNKVIVGVHPGATNEARGVLVANLFSNRTAFGTHYFTNFGGNVCAIFSNTTANSTPVTLFTYGPFTNRSVFFRGEFVANTSNQVAAGVQWAAYAGAADGTLTLGGAFSTAGAIAAGGGAIASFTASGNTVIYRVVGSASSNTVWAAKIETLQTQP